jgi:hypothetical protein
MNRKTSLNFKKQPACELLPDHFANYFSFQRGKWFFVCSQALEDRNEYDVPINEFFASPANTVDWLAHLAEKQWFNAEDFCAMIHRFRKATDSYH